jgi:hypothetical protein
MRMDIIFRSCTRVTSLHPGERPCQATKSEVTLSCLYSLICSADAQTVIHVLDDHSFPEDVEKMRAMLARHDSVSQFIPLGVTGNGLSMEASFRYAREQGFELIYFCEDDYLHCPLAIPTMKRIYADLDGKCIIHPTDYIDRYLRDKPYLSLIYLGCDRHWRTIKHTTGTFMVSRNILLKYWKYYQAFADHNKGGEAGGEDVTINKIYQKELCLSPMPSLAAHFSPLPEMPRFVDWERLFLQYNKERSFFCA